MTPKSLAIMADQRGFQEEAGHYTIKKNVQEYSLKDVDNTTSECEEYKDFTWSDLFYKLCFEQMLDNFSKLRDFKILYEYINEIGDKIRVLRVKVQDKTKLKSNHYWILVLLSKL